MPEEEIRWHYRFQNFSRAFSGCRAHRKTERRP